jgi:hypothetical protein
MVGLLREHNNLLDKLSVNMWQGGPKSKSRDMWYHLEVKPRLKKRKECGAYQW